jgi:hypothetical protein
LPLRRGGAQGRDIMPKAKRMEPIVFDAEIAEVTKIKSDPAFQEMAAGVHKEMTALLRDPSRLGIKCCFEGCCVGWCCIQLI